MGTREHEGFPYAATIYPPLKAGSGFEEATFDDAEAQAWLDRLLPLGVRGKMVPYGMPGDGDRAARHRLGTDLHARFECGAIVGFHGDADTLRWNRVRIIWHGPPRTWSPVAACR